jgi:DNA-binding NtrC family response regulator
MNMLNSCIVLVDEENIKEWRDHALLPTNTDKANPYKYTKAGNFNFVSPDSEEFSSVLKRNCDLLIIEDDALRAAEIAVYSIRSQKIKDVIIASSIKCVEELLESNWKAPPVITLDFNLRDKSEVTIEIFELTKNLYMKLKKAWKDSTIIGVSAWIHSTGEIEEEARDLVDNLRANDDDVFPKGDLFLQFVPYLIRNAFGRYELRQKNNLLEKKASISVSERDEIRYLSELPSRPPENDLPERSPVKYIIGQSLAMRHIYYFLEKFADEPLVSIEGETGTGKELIALALHQLSNRKDKPFAIIDCAQLEGSGLLDSELFGHEKGAFTDARERKIGLIEKARGGTIFLDEIGVISIPFQNKLLRLINNGEFKRAGGNQIIRADVNIITATNKVLQELVGQGAFKEDLYYRLEFGFPRLPRLNERNLDIILLARHFLKAKLAETKRQDIDFSDDALNQLCLRQWKGNVRQLKNVINRTVVLLPNNARQIDSGMLRDVSSSADSDTLISDKDYKLDNDSPKGLFDSYQGSRGRLGKAWDYLNAIDRAVQEVKINNVEPTLENVGALVQTPNNKMAITGQWISMIFRDYKKEIIILCENYEKWTFARSLKGFPRND